MSKILVIDDEESIRTMMRMTLELDGHQVLTAEDGPSALDIFQKERPAIVLLDVRMPGMDGIEVLERIRAVAPDTEVIIVTGHGDMEMAIKCLRRNASNFLTKPVDDEILSLALKRSEEKLALKKKLRQYTENLETLVREANVELEKAYRFRENLIENSPDAIISVRKGGQIIIFNSAAEKLIGYDKGEVVHKMNIADLYPPGEAKAVMKALRSEEFGGRGILQKREMALLDRYGNQIPVLLSAAILYEEGKEAGSVGIFTDLRERKILEKKLLKNLLLTENLIENSPSATIFVREGGEVAIFNSAAEKLLGYKKEEVIGKMNAEAFYPPGQAKQVLTDLRSEEYGGPGVVQRKETAVLDQHGNEIPVLLYAAILYEEGVETGSVCIFHDLRIRKELEKQLLHSLHFRENLIENSPDAIICVQKPGDIIVWNSAAEKLLGYKKEDVIGKVNIRDLYRPGEAVQIMKDMRSGNFGGPGILQKREITVRDKDLNPIPVYLSAAILYEEGKEAGSVGILTDLRERKVLEKKLLSNLLLMDNLVENSPSATIFIRRDGRVAIFNTAAEKLLGYKKEEVIDKMSVDTFYPPGLPAQIMKELRSDEYGGPGIVERREMTLLDKNHNEIPVYLYAAIVYEDGQEAGTLGIVTDQRERKELEKQLMRSEKLSSLGKLSAGIAHEINQPLTGVLTFASLLAKKFQNDEKTRKDLDIIVRETKRIRGIVQRVLNFGRETPMQKKPVQIESALEQTLKIVAHQERFFGIKLVRDYASSLPEVIADSGVMEQVFMNITLNAAEAMNGSGTLTVRTRQEKKWVVIDFEDTGRGIPESILDKIFDPFFSTKDSTEGSAMGLGLALSYGIIKDHDGDITVKSKVGQGTTFTIKLPIPPAPKA